MLLLYLTDICEINFLSSLKGLPKNGCINPKVLAKFFMGNIIYYN